MPREIRERRLFRLTGIRVETHVEAAITLPIEPPISWECLVIFDSMIFVLTVRKMLGERRVSPFGQRDRLSQTIYSGGMMSNTPLYRVSGLTIPLVKVPSTLREIFHSLSPNCKS